MTTERTIAMLIDRLGREPESLYGWRSGSTKEEQELGKAKRELMALCYRAYRLLNKK